MTTREEILHQINWQPLNTVADIKAMRSLLEMLEYHLTPKGGWLPSIQPVLSAILQCNEPACGERRTLFIYRSLWYCADHLPAGITFPIAMHGETFERYKKRTRG